MRNLLTFLALACALASCKKECESDHTATLVFKNKGTLVAYVEIDKKYHPVEPGKSSSFDFPLLVPGSSEVIYQTTVDFRWGSPDGERASQGVVFNQCETTTVEASN